MQAGWTDITFESRQAYPPKVTVSWSLTDKSVRKMNVNISKSLLEALKWTGSEKFLIFATDDRSIIAITPGRVGKKMHLKRSGSGIFSLNMLHVKIWETIPAQETKHAIVGDSLHITLPDWATVGTEKIKLSHPDRPMHRSIMNTPDPAAAARARR